MRRTERSRAGAGTGLEVMGFAGGEPRAYLARRERSRRRKRPGEASRPDRRALPSPARLSLRRPLGNGNASHRHRLSTLAAGVMKAVRASATRLRAMGTAGSGPAMKRQSPFCRLSTRIGGHDEGGPARGGAARCDGDGTDRARRRAVESPRFPGLSVVHIIAGRDAASDARRFKPRRGASRAGRIPATRAKGAPFPAAAPCSGRRRAPYPGPGGSR